MMNLSVLVHENDSPHIYIYILKYYLLHVSARGEGVEIYNCDNKFSILGASFTGIVKNARVLRHRCDISICWNCSPVDHVHYTCKHSCFMLFAPLHFDQGITKILMFPSAKWDICPALRGQIKRRTPGNGLRPLTRAQEYLCFDGLKAWHIH